MSHVDRVRWEYLSRRPLLNDPCGSDLDRMLDDLGSRGWELVSISGDELFVFKRPLPCGEAQ